MGSFVLCCRNWVSLARPRWGWPFPPSLLEGATFRVGPRTSWRVSQQSRDMRLKCSVVRAVPFRDQAQRGRRWIFLQFPISHNPHAGNAAEEQAQGHQRCVTCSDTLLGEGRLVPKPSHARSFKLFDECFRLPSQASKVEERPLDGVPDYAFAPVLQLPLSEGRDKDTAEHRRHSLSGGLTRGRQDRPLARPRRLICSRPTWTCVPPRTYFVCGADRRRSLTATWSFA